MFIVLLTYQRSLDEIDALMGEHVAWLKHHYASGLFIASGRKVPRDGGVILARSGERAALEAIVQEDPFIAHGVAKAELIEFTPSMTAPGAEVLKQL
jgi:uncharacterized protein YciI